MYPVTKINENLHLLHHFPTPLSLVRNHPKYASTIQQKLAEKPNLPNLN